MGRVRIRLSPRARRSELLGRHGSGWKARVAEPPERGRANAALEALLADALGVQRMSVRVVSGHGSRDKLLEVDGLDAREIEARLFRRGR
jgi:uncharacterized protein